MIVYRLSKSQYKHDLSGKGAEIAGGRWNSRGVAMLYTSQSRALCLAEVLVHQPRGKLADDFWMVTIEVPDTALILRLSQEDLPADWRVWPPPFYLRSIGDSFVYDARYLALAVPSAVVPGDENLLFNPKHSDFPSLRIVEDVPFRFDPRLSP
ncbi:MAG: RES family NAD+ phosphorylase [Saprospiraceae bacterium]